MLVKVVTKQALDSSAWRTSYLTPKRFASSSNDVPQKLAKTREDKLARFEGKRFPDFESNYRKRGTGGRSSFSGLTATIFNGGGFLASKLCGRLGKSGTQLVIAYRGSGYTEEKLRTAGDLGQVYYAPYTLKDEDSLYRAMEYSNVVVNCIGSLNETRNFSFEEVHVEGPRRMARIARQLGVKKFIHMSSINASPNPEPIILKKGSEFLRSKYYGELAVREEFPDAVIIRPSDMIGEVDNFVTHYCSMRRSAYTKTLYIWDYYFEVEKQPIWVHDVIDGIERAIRDDSADGQTFQAVGPFRYNFYDLIEYMRSCSGMGQKYDESEIKNLRWNPILRLFITLSEKLFKSPMVTWERCEKDSLSDFIDPTLPTLRNLGVELTPLEYKIQMLGYYQPRYIRVEVPFEAQDQIDPPVRLNALV